jgi:hypothetical protein
MTDASEIPVVSSGTTYKITGSTLEVYFTGNVEFAGTTLQPRAGATESNITLKNGTSAVDILAANGNVAVTAGANSWTFGNTGNLAYPDGTISTGGAVYAAANASVQLISNNENTQVRVDNSNVEIYTSPNGITQYQWTFGNTGTLTLPGGSRLRPLGSNLDIFAGTGSYVNLITSDESSSMGVDNSGGYITTAGGTWNFGTTGNLTAPGNITAGNLDAVNLVISTIYSDDSSFVNIADGLNVTGDVISTGFTSTPTAIANLVATVGSRAFINNSNLAATAGWGTQVSGGGSNIVPVWSDGANWYIG